MFPLHSTFPAYGALTQVPMELSPLPTHTEALIMSQLVRSRTPTPPIGNPQRLAHSLRLFLRRRSRALQPLLRPVVSMVPKHGSAHLS
jgi:hypothetical protein